MTPSTGSGTLLGEAPLALEGCGISLIALVGVSLSTYMLLKAAERKSRTEQLIWGWSMVVCILTYLRSVGIV
jgi:hypothetical protein